MHLLLDGILFDTNSCWTNNPPNFDIGRNIGHQNMTNFCLHSKPTHTPLLGPKLYQDYYMVHDALGRDEPVLMKNALRRSISDYIIT